MISIIVPTHNRHTSLLKLLGSLQEQEVPPCPVEIIVVSNLEDAVLSERLRDFKSLFETTFLHCGKLGVNRARNLGAEKSRGEILVFFDDDCLVYDKKYLQKIHSLHRKNPDAAAIGGCFSLTGRYSKLEQTYHKKTNNWLLESHYSSEETTNLAGGNVSYKSEAFQKLGGFNADIVFGGAETELHIRFLRCGHRLLLIDDLMVEHALSMGVWEFLKKAFLQGRSMGIRCQLGLVVPQELEARVKKYQTAYPVKCHEYDMIESFWINTYRRVWGLGREWVEELGHQKTPKHGQPKKLVFGISLLRYLRTLFVLPIKLCFKWVSRKVQKAKS